jgi:glyoxylase-like metal-dependent hydrolase (beta-lactamase superfamily II)
VQRLAELRITPGDIDLLISTHFDFDHCGRHDAFAAEGITSLVQREHLDAPATIHGSIPPYGTSRASPTLRLMVTSSWSRGCV